MGYNIIRSGTWLYRLTSRGAWLPHLICHWLEQVVHKKINGCQFDQNFENLQGSVIILRVADGVQKNSFRHMAIQVD
jgi:hypothetical protein